MKDFKYKVGDIVVLKKKSPIYSNACLSIDRRYKKNGLTVYVGGGIPFLEEWIR